jgi:tetratricopeptide (TPR) repeat protein
MKGALRTIVLLIAGAIALFVLLIIAPKTQPSLQAANTAPGGFTAPAGSNLGIYLNMALKNLAPDKKADFDRLLSQRKSDSLSAFWMNMRRPDLAAHFAEEKAKSANSQASWKEAGNRYYNSVQFTSDKSEAPVLYQSAIRCLTKAVELDPTDTDAKITLAACYVEGSSDPMQGISRLKEIERTDSNNVKLQMTFALFSVRSQQTEKAIARFKKVLSIDSSYIEAYLHLADAYEQQGKTDETIKMLESYAARTNDVTAKLEIKKYIEQLRTK